MTQGTLELPSVTVLIPCLNEELGIATVIAELREAVPQAQLWVIDNKSTDSTADVARDAGADRLLFEERPGKAMAIRTALEQVESDLVILIDGDASYPGSGAARLFQAYLESPADMINGVRKPETGGEGKTAGESEFRPLHQTGSKVFAMVLRVLFRHRVTDIFSGLCLLTRRLYNHVPILSKGFELEMELTVQCLDKGFRYRDVDVPFRARARGSESKLNTLRDGFRILKLLLLLFRDYRPFLFFGICSFVLLLLGFASGYLPINDYITTGTVYKVPMAILATSLVILSFLFFLTGVMLESGLRHHRESFQIFLRNSEKAAGRERNNAPHS